MCFIIREVILKISFLYSDNKNRAKWENDSLAICFCKPRVFLSTFFFTGMYFINIFLKIYFIFIVICLIIVYSCSLLLIKKHMYYTQR